MMKSKTISAEKFVKEQLRKWESKGGDTHDSAYSKDSWGKALSKIHFGEAHRGGCCAGPENRCLSFRFRKAKWI